MLLWYEGDESIGIGDDGCGGGGGEGGEDIYNSKAEPVLVSVSDSYSEDDAISVGDSRYSSYPAYTVYWLPCLLTTALREM